MVDLNKMKVLNKNVEDGLKKEYMDALKEENFSSYVRRIKLPNEVLMKYTQRLLTSYNECVNCINCKSLSMCKNEVYGFYLKPVENNSSLTFEYKSCKYKNKEIKETSNVYFSLVPDEIKNARMKNIYLDDKNRKEVLTYLTKFIKEYNSDNRIKGIYLSGNFGCGKTYLIASTFNELSRKNIKSAIIYWPEFLRNLKSSFNDDYNEKFDYIKKVELLLIDDIGAENVTEWGRDEILGTILQYRMEQKLTTFFTSNLNYEELESALSITKGKVDLLKSRRIMERIKNLTIPINLIGINRRN